MSSTFQKAPTSSDTSWFTSLAQPSSRRANNIYKKQEARHPQDIGLFVYHNQMLPRNQVLWVTLCETPNSKRINPVGSYNFESRVIHGP